MIVMIVALSAVLLLDQAVKFLVVHSLRGESISLGLAGTVRCVPNQIWIARLKLPVIWILWISAALALIELHTLFPIGSWFCGLLLGGSLSHVIEMSTRGYICDYVCLRFWPAFNIADVAITAGAIGTTVSLLGIAIQGTG